MAMRKIIFISIILAFVIFILGCQEIKTNPKLESLENNLLTQEEIKELGIQINTSRSFIYTSEDYYSDYPSVKHVSGFQGSFTRRYYFYGISNTDYVHIDITIFDSFEHAKEYYEDQVEFTKDINEALGVIIEENKEYSFGDVSTVLEDKGITEEAVGLPARGHHIYFVKDNHFVEVRTTLYATSGIDVPLEKLVEVARIVELRLK